MFDTRYFHSLRSGNFGAELYYLSEVDSTNRVAGELATKGMREGTVVLAESQTAGRGRNAHSWYSPPFVNLYFTILLYPPADRLHYLPFLTSVSLAETLEIYGVQCDLKWPNDILVGRKKIAGVLIQTSVEENRLRYAIVGIGMNVNAKSFSATLDSVAISMFQIITRESNREELLATFLSKFEGHYSTMKELSWDELREMVQRRSTYIQGCEVKIEQQGRVIMGTTAGLDPMGGLVLETELGPEVFYAGEVEACRKK